VSSKVIRSGVGVGCAGCVCVGGGWTKSVCGVGVWTLWLGSTAELEQSKLCNVCDFGHLRLKKTTLEKTLCDTEVL
jgi:hypothetical protein